MRKPALFTIALVALSSPDVAHANSNGIAVEGVSDYTLINGGSISANIDGAQEVCGFLYTMTNGTAPTDYNACLTATKNTGNTGFVKNVEEYNGTVWDTDVVDPDTSGYSLDNDTYNFDKSGSAFSFLAVHGNCNDVATNLCSSVCSLGQFCTDKSPKTGLSDVCVNQSPRLLIFSSSQDKHGHVDQYGKPAFGPEAGSIRFGESPQSGGWAGAGTNGGANGVFIVNSCGTRGPTLFDNTKGMFAGAHSINMLTPSGAAKDSYGNLWFSDSWTLNQRGSVVAQLMLANEFASISSAWRNPMAMNFGLVGPTPPTPIPTPTPTMSPHGAHLSVSFDATASLASWHIQTEGPLGALYDSNDATGNGNGAAIWTCTYDCNTYGL